MKPPADVPNQGKALVNPRYSAEPEERERFARKNDRVYTAFAGLYSAAVRLFPVWKRWIEHAIPHVEGPRVLEVSFGTGHLLARYAGRFEAHGIDYNRRMAEVAREELGRAGVRAGLVQGSVENLPYRDEAFDSVVNTMAFSGYPAAVEALSEIKRVLRSGGKLILIDVNFPADGNWLGTRWVEFWKLAGDLIRDMGPLFERLDMDHSDQEIGGSGSIHLYVARK
jgi:ubiquinone/menaquinone biosynthesis C-methylase UbiE